MDEPDIRVEIGAEIAAAPDSKTTMAAAERDQHIQETTTTTTTMRGNSYITSQMTH